jgi:hypothetical protein
MPREIAVAHNPASENLGDEVPVTEAKRSFFTLSVHSTHEYHQLKLRFNHGRIRRNPPLKYRASRNRTVAPRHNTLTLCLYLFRTYAVEAVQTRLLGNNQSKVAQLRHHSSFA